MSLQIQPDENSQIEKQKIIRFIQRFSDIAGSYVRKVRIQVLLSLFSAAWITFYISHLFATHIITSLIIIAILCLPGLLLLKFYFILIDITELPATVQDMGDSFKVILTKSKKQLSEEMDIPATASPKKLKTFFNMSKTMFTLMGTIDDALGISDIMQNMILLTNPLFIILTIAAFFISWFFMLLSFTTLVIFLI